MNKDAGGILREISIRLSINTYTSVSFWLSQTIQELNLWVDSTVKALEKKGGA